MPLADILRPTKLADYIGQTHLVGEGKPIANLIKSGKLTSLIFWGPPGVGKTTLARIIATETNHPFHELSAVSAGKADIKKIVDDANPLFNNSQILFLDEIHRFNKAQQDFLLPYVENGRLILIGATTENPSFSVISPLLSRCQVYVLEELSADDLRIIAKRTEVNLKLTLTDEARDYVIAFGNGDGRKVINLLEHLSNLSSQANLTLDQVKTTLQSKFLRYDTGGEEHYNTISAFIKSMRASQPDAALYYLARMVNAGEDPLFIARRMVIFASEDVGIAAPTALVVANAVYEACKNIGYPECQENLAAGVVYLANCKKDRSAYNAYFKALDDVKKYGNLPIPMEIRNAPTKLMKDLGYGQNYQQYTQASLLPETIKHHHYL